ncbi:MAG: hypothetical protein ACK5NN_05875 [Sphingomonadaceae bacterium]
MSDHSDQISALLQTINAARQNAAQWLLDHIGSDGVPEDSADKTGWPRVGWGLSVAGHVDVAARIVEWAARNRIEKSGAFRPGYANGQGYISSTANYWLGTYVISAWMTGHLSVARQSLAFLKSQQDTATGGILMVASDGNAPPSDGVVCEMLSTAQVGLSALVAGDHELAHGCARWVRSMARQDARESLLFHGCMIGNELWVPPAGTPAWSLIVDFSKPREAYFPPAMGAVFLARYSARYNCAESLDAARRLLQFSRLGNPAQFDDVESVQACKYGWAVGEMYFADREGNWLEQVMQMAGWFLDRQTPEGWWGPSEFADPAPGIADRMIKTSEHLMELSVLASALGAEQVNSVG